MARVLVVEDNPTNLDLMVYLLRAFGHEVLTARDGGEGLAVLRRERPDVALVDVHMAPMDGLEMVRRVHEDPPDFPVRLAAVTALAMVGDRERVLAAGFDGYISKPIDPERFVGQVEALLSERPSARTPLPRIAGETGRVARCRGNRRPRILVADDSGTNLGLARSILEPFGYDVVTARSVREALELARENSPDLILSDVHMPTENGFDFITSTRADPNLCGVPFVFISSTVWRDSDRERGLALGARKFLLRPIEPEAFLAEIEACLERD